MGSEMCIRDRVKMAPYILCYTPKHKLARIHITGKCWRKPGIDYKNYEYIYELEDALDQANFCKDCLAKDEETKGSSEDSSSSTEVDPETEDEEAKRMAEESRIDKIVTKKLVENLGKSEALGQRKRRRIGPKPVPKKTAPRPESEEALDESNIFGEREELAIEPVAPGGSSL